MTDLSRLAREFSSQTRRAHGEQSADEHKAGERPQTSEARWIGAVA